MPGAPDHDPTDGDPEVDTSGGEAGDTGELDEDGRAEGFGGVEEG